MGWLIAYDIASVRRWRRVHRFLRGEASKLQYSLFWANCSHEAARRLARRLDDMIDPSEDDVRLYPFSDTARVDVLGPSPWGFGVADAAARRFSKTDLSRSCADVDS